MAVEILSSASHFLSVTRKILFPPEPPSDYGIFTRWFSDATKPPENSNFVIDRNGFLVLKSGRRTVINEEEERIRTDWLEKGIVPPENSGFIIDSNNYVRRKEDVDREAQELTELEQELQRMLSQTPVNA